VNVNNNRRAIEFGQKHAALCGVFEAEAVAAVATASRPASYVLGRVVNETYNAETETIPRHWSDGIETETTKTFKNRLETETFETETTTLVVGLDSRDVDYISATCHIR